MARHRIHSLSFKKQVVQEYAAGAPLNGLAREYDLSRNLIRIWSPSPRAASSILISKLQPRWRIMKPRSSTLERMVGRQALEIELLKGALQQGRFPRSAPMSVIAGPAVSPSLKDAG